MLLCKRYKKLRYIPVTYVHVTVLVGLPVRKLIVMSTNTLAHLFRLALKNAHEFQQMMQFQNSLDDDIVGWALNLQQNGIHAAVTNHGKQGVTLELKQQGLRYYLHVPPVPQDFKKATLTLELSRAGAIPQRVTLTGQELLDLQLVPAYQALQKFAVHFVQTNYLSKDALVASPEVTSNAIKSTETAPPESSSEETSPQAQEAPATGNEATQPAQVPAPEAPAPEFTDYVIYRDNAANLKVKGKVIGRTRTVPYAGRYKVFTVIQSQGGKFVGIKEGVSMHLGERNTSEAQVFDSFSDLPGFFGYSPVAKALYEQMGQSAIAVEEIE